MNKRKIKVPGTLKNKNMGIVSPLPKNAAEALYEARKAKLKEVCYKHGVLINDGWTFMTDEFISDLANVQ